MKSLTMYQIDAFSDCTFEGNPAAVVPLDEWLSVDVMQSIAAENNLAETAFFVPKGVGYYIRWFTPTTEVKLCGHATLASAYVLFEQLDYQKETITFDSLSGALTVSKNEKGITLNFPAQAPVSNDLLDQVAKALGAIPIACLENEDIIVVFDSAETVKNLTPDLSELSKLPLRGVIVTAQADNYDFVARCFAPKYGIDEDPVTGSAYTQLTPYWASQLNKTEFRARQVSKRGGDVHCELSGDRVLISGNAVMYLKGEIYL